MAHSVLMSPAVTLLGAISRLFMGGERRKSMQGKTSPKGRGRWSSGQTAVIFSLVAVTLLGATALGTDVAILYMNWMRLQKATDASALAGANYLPNDPGTAKSTAKTYALANGVASAEWITPTIAPNNLQITVGAQRVVPYYFARVLGMTTGNVSVSSTATTQGAPSCIGCPTLVGGQGTGPGGSASGGSSGGGTTVVGSGSGTTAAVCGTTTTTYDVIPIVVDNQTAAAWTSGGSYT